MSYQQPPSSSNNNNNNLPPFDWSVPGRNFNSGAPPPLMAMPNRDDVRLPSTMERVLKFRDNQHEEDRVTKLHSGGGGHQTDSGIDQNDEYDDESDEETTPQNGLSRKAKKEVEKRRRRRAKKKTKSTAAVPPTPQPPIVPQSTKSSDNSSKENDKRKKTKKHESDDEDDHTNVEIEYVPEDLPVKRGDGYYSHFVKVFENFKLDQNGDDSKFGKKLLGPKALLPRDKTNIDENEDDDDEKETNNHDKKKKDDDDDEQNKKKSKKQMKRETRFSVAQLKQLVIRPDVVEMFDVTAKDPKLLVHLKATRNTVPVPRHWCAKRKYLQGKRGIEKPPFQLPDFIRRTGIMEMREALQEKEQNKTLKQKMREKVRPKLGKIDIDYQKLHDAFFRWQTKPRMSIHGDLYYEGKENETRLKDKKPGILSEELRVALGIPVGPTADKYPPPWLIAMQRYGPPPSYPNLKIPGLNAPIPEGCQFGYHSGGWGKPPVDEHGRPLYGDVFGTNQFAYIRSMTEEEHIDKSYWGEIEEEEQEQEAASSSDEEETTEDTGLDSELATDGQSTVPTATDHTHHHVHHHHAASEQEQIIHPAGFQTPHGSEGFATPSGTQSSILGTETPQQFELRKSRFHAEMDGDVTPSLYTVLPEKNVGVGQSSLLSTNRVYDFQAIRKDQMGQSGTNRPDTSGGVDIALNPDELDMNSQALEARYRQELNNKEIAKEDLSDMVSDHLNKTNKKRKGKPNDPNAKGGDSSAAKNLKKFKF
ncbi:unnamed protein product [Adineta steineri]|uniref:PSP proline-rich domain-containing protein n=1 Tax=Adineta steineri TaxID=433720 RepID=A0A814RCW0_9BILA|nr:unnamed protein product [Adineta steineri]CAF3619190.1 unnamed protein product [Adineta steineri]